MQGYNELRDDVARIDVAGLVALELSGSDAESWLQGQITNDVRLLKDSEWLDACLVKSTGQLEDDLRIFALDKVFVLLTERPAVIRERVERFVIMEDVELRELGAVSASIQGPNAQISEVSSGSIVLRSPRTGTQGYEVVGEHTFREDIAWSDKEAFDLLTLENRIPQVKVDADEKTLPPELGADFESSHVSYEKGCYVGQEILQRIHSRGHTNKIWKVFTSTLEPDPNEMVYSAEKSVGRVTRFAKRPDGTVLLGAMLQVSALGSNLHLKRGPEEHNLSG